MSLSCAAATPDSCPSSSTGIFPMSSSLPSSSFLPPPVASLPSNPPSICTSRVSTSSSSSLSTSNRTLAPVLPAPPLLLPSSSSFSLPCCRSQILFQGHILLSIRLCSTEVAALRPPPPYFVMPLRLSYLPQLVEEAFQYFRPFLQPSFGLPVEPSFRRNGRLLDWRLPVGLLFDLLHGDDGRGGGGRSSRRRRKEEVVGGDGWRRRRRDGVVTEEGMMGGGGGRRQHVVDSVQAAVGSTSSSWYHGSSGSVIEDEEDIEEEGRVPWDITINFHTNATRPVQRTAPQVGGGSAPPAVGFLDEKEEDGSSSRGGGVTQGEGELGEDMDAQDTPPYRGWRSFESLLMNSLKQMSYLANGSIISFQRLSKARELEMLEALQTSNLGVLFDIIATHLLPLPSQLSYQQKSPIPTSSSAASSSTRQTPSHSLLPSHSPSPSTSRTSPHSHPGLISEDFSTLSRYYRIPIRVHVAGRSSLLSLLSSFSPFFPLPPSSSLPSTTTTTAAAAQSTAAAIVASRAAESAAPSSEAAAAPTLLGDFLQQLLPDMFVSRATTAGGGKEVSAAAVADGRWQQQEEEARERRRQGVAAAAEESSERNVGRVGVCGDGETADKLEKRKEEEMDPGGIKTAERQWTGEGTIEGGSGEEQPEPEAMYFSDLSDNEEGNEFSGSTDRPPIPPAETVHNDSENTENDRTTGRGGETSPSALHLSSSQGIPPLSILQPSTSNAASRLDEGTGDSSGGNSGGGGRGVGEDMVEEDGGSGGGGGGDCTGSSSSGGGGVIDGYWYRRCSVAIQGVRAPLETPLLWLISTCPSGDGFLHIVLRAETG
eukprot:GHVS01030366.1.p1 GENE.GHVS01030366.1~~GHVS01030366.1.p1  ORF type:complete len:824 (-),score=265.07 GHVS01030366.1:496-2967(-)